MSSTGDEDSVFPSLKYNDELLFRIPEDYIDSNNYMKHNNILHTELYSDKGRVLINSLLH